MTFVAIFLFLLFVLFVLTEGFFSGSEIALVSASRVKALGLAKEGDRGAKFLIEFWKNPERILTATLIGTNLSVVSATTLFTYLVLLVTEGTGVEEWRHFSILFLAPFIMIFGEMVPKMVFRRRADAWAPSLVVVLNPISRLLGIPGRFVSSFVRRLSMAGGYERGYLPLITREELRSLLELPRSKEMGPFEKSLLHRVSYFSEKTVREIMIPLVDVRAVEEGETIENVLKIFEDTGHSRLVVYKERVDNITGILSYFDLFHRGERGERVKDLQKKARYIPETLSIASLLKEMREEGTHLAVVVDEYGGASGIVTIEDILEEIVGEIEDEFDARKSPSIILKGPDTYWLQGRISLKELELATGAKIPDGDYETVGGFILEKMGRIPKVNDLIEFGNLSFIVERATDRAIEELLLIIRRKGKGKG